MLVTRAGLREGEWVLAWGIGSGVVDGGARDREGARRTGDRHLVERREARRAARARRRRRVQPRDRRRRRGGEGARPGAARTSWSSTSARRRGSARSMRRGRRGEIVVCGATTGPNPPADLHRIWWKQLSILGSTMGTTADFEAAYELVKIGPCVAGRRRGVPARRSAPQRTSGWRPAQQLGKIVLRSPAETRISRSRG